MDPFSWLTHNIFTHICISTRITLFTRRQIIIPFQKKLKYSVKHYRKHNRNKYVHKLRELFYKYVHYILKYHFI